MGLNLIIRIRQRLIEYAGRHALAFMLWRWRASEAERVRLKQRVRELEALLDLNA